MSCKGMPVSPSNLAPGRAKVTAHGSQTSRANWVARLGGHRCRHRAGAGAGRRRRLAATLNGAYDTFLDHSQQTFNGQPRPSEPSIQPAQFTTTCDAAGCSAHWLLVDPLVGNPNAPSLFDYQWVNDRWVSSSDYRFTATTAARCRPGGRCPDPQR